MIIPLIHFYRNNIMSPVYPEEVDDIHHQCQIIFKSQSYHRYHHDISKKHSVKSKEFLIWLRTQMKKDHQRNFVYVIKYREWNMENVTECLAEIGRKDLSRELPDWFV